MYEPNYMSCYIHGRYRSIANIANISPRFGMVTTDTHVTDASATKSSALMTG